MGIKPVAPTTRIDDVSCHVLRGDFWGNCDLRDDVLYLEWVSWGTESKGRGTRRACATKASLMRDVMIVLFPTPSICMVSVCSRRGGRAHRRRRGECGHPAS